MNKDKTYYELINKIVELNNYISDLEKEYINSDYENEHECEKYLQDGYGLISDVYQMLIDRGFSKEEIDFDAAHT